MISSKVFERWLISITDIPTLGSDSMSRCASSKTGSGKTAGPALKLKILSVMSLLLECAGRAKRRRRFGLESDKLQFVASNNQKACGKERQAKAYRTSKASSSRRTPKLSFLSMRSEHRSCRTQNKRTRHEPFSLDHKKIGPAGDGTTLAALERSQCRVHHFLRRLR